MTLSKAEEEELELALQSILYNNDDLLRELVLENPALVKFSDSNGRTVLHHAAGKGHTSCTLVLLESGADIDALSSTKDGLKSPLMLASEQGKSETSEILVNYGADLFASDLNGHSALQLAQLKGHNETADLLINSLENIHSRATQLRSKLCSACIDNDFEVVQEVMDEVPRSAHKQVLNGETGDEKSALYLACEHGRVQILTALFKFSSKHSILYTPTGDTILHAAVASQDLATVDTVIQKFPYLMDVPNNDGSLVLHWACRCGNLEVVKILLEHTYPKSELKPVENGHGGESFYQFACDLNAADNECRTPLYLAVANGHTHLLHYLTTFKLAILQSREGVQSSSTLECPFLLDVYCNNGRTPLMIACVNGNVDMVKILLDNGADVNLPVALTDVEISNLKPMEEARCAGSGALIEAAKGGDLELVGLLLRHGALDYDNKALAVAVENEKWDLVSSFLCQLAFPDPEYRINKQIGKGGKEVPLTNLLLNTTNLLPQVHPNTGCQLNWHEVSVDRLALDWLVNAALRINTRVRQPRLALSAITRLDLSNNRLTLLPHTVFQLPSLRILNVDENCIGRIEVPANGDWHAACLETCSMANNYIVELPVGLFSGKLMPQLKVLNLSNNRLHHLPPEIWTAPRLRELNCMNNQIINISSTLEEQETRQHRQNGGYRRQERLPRRQQSRHEEQPARGDSESRAAEAASAALTPRPEGKPWAEKVTDMDVIRVNIWQKKIQLSNIEDYDYSDNTASSALDPNQGRAVSSTTDGQIATSSSSSSALRMLNLSGNKLKQVPRCLACCAPRLTRLDLSMNEISCIGPVECLPASLRHLNMANNQLSRCFTHHPMTAVDSSMVLCCQAPLNSAASISQQSKPGPVALNNSYSVNRHSRSRSKSVARNQRSLSVIRAAEGRSSGGVVSNDLEPCIHRSHCRLEALKSLNLSHNRLQTLDLMVAFGGGSSGLLEHFNWKENGQQMKSYMLFPALTTLDLSHNQLKCVPPTISLLSYLAILNLASNHELDTLPPELGLLDKLWNVVLKDCPLKKEQEPLRSMVNDNYKTTEVLLNLRNKLENSKLYPKMKLMLVGGPEVGKSTLLQSVMRQEGQISKKALQSESWARRMGHTPAKGFSPSSSAKNYPSPTGPSGNQLLSAIRKGFPVDVVEWSFEPKKSSKTTPANTQEVAVGAVTFRTWDFTGLQKEFAVIQQYFFTRRCLYLVVWKVTEGEIALNEIHGWLLAIQARAPNSTVLIIGTHADYVKDNTDQRFPREYLEELHNTIQDRFVNVSDAEKKGLPKVLASIYVSSKSKDDIKSLCNLLYQVAAEIRSIGSGSSRRNKMLSQKVPASFVALEKIVVSVTDELRTKGEEPILRFDDFWVLATTQMIEEYGKPFRDILEFRQACNFLHENGILVHFDDTSLREFVFIDPPWLCALLRAAISGNSSPSSPQSSIHQHSIVDKQSLYSSLKFALRHFGQMTTHLTAGRQNSTGVALVKFRLFRACLLNLLAKFELALPCLNKMVLLASLLPDEYLLRADYPGARVKIHSKVDKWQLRAGPSFQPLLYVDPYSNTTSPPTSSTSMVSPIRQYLTHKRLARTLALLAPSESRNSSIDEGVGASGSEGNSPGGLLLQGARRKSSVVTSCANNSLSVPSPPASLKIQVEKVKENTLRRLYVMQYIPPGFWARLTTRLLDDEKLGSTLSKLLTVTSCSPASDHSATSSEPSSLQQPPAHLLASLNQTINNYGGMEETGEKETSFIIGGGGKKSPTCCEKGEVCAAGDQQHSFPANTSTGAGGFHWLLWQTGVEIRAFDTHLFSLKQFLPLANVLDLNYSMVALEKRGEDEVWRPLPLDSNVFLLELLIPAGCRIKVEWNGGAYNLEIDKAVATKFLSIVVNVIDDLLEDWFPALGTRFVHSSEGRLLVDRLIPCYHCAQHSMEQVENASVRGRNSEKSLAESSEQTQGGETPAIDDLVNDIIYLFSVEECILEAKNSSVMFSSAKSWTPEPKFVREKSAQESGELVCPRHSHIALDLMAPDVVFADLSCTDLVVQPDNIKRGKLVGRGAFGFVFNGFVRQKNDTFSEVALKILEPVHPGSTSISSNAGGGSARAAFEAFSLKWNSDALGGQLENCARSYCTARQELNMLADIRHSHVTSLIGFSVQPMTLVVEWAPQGALDVMLAKYKRCNTKLYLNTLQQTCVQIAKALEYLHVTNHIIYRDLKSENVLVWRFPPPYSMGSMDVHVKLGDYGISRYSYPSGICKGYGGTEGFMAPEVMRYNGEEEYTEKVDCFSFGMFLYELISLKQPYEGHEQMKEFLLEGRRPYVSEKELLLPSNLLDLMVICWSESAELRPSSSQLVGICSAPEFTHLLDVAVLRDGEEPNLALIVNSYSKQLEDFNEREQCSHSCWISRSTRNSIVALSYSQFGWTDKKVIELSKSALANPPAITSMCQVEENIVWIGDTAGKITICNCSFLTEVSTFNITDLKSDAQMTTKQTESCVPNDHPKSCAIEHILAFEERQMVVISLRNCLLICRDLVYNGCEGNQTPQLLARIELKSGEEIFNLAILHSLTDWQIWTAHSNEKIFIHHISCNTDKLIFSTSISHSAYYNVAPNTAYTGPQGDQLAGDVDNFTKMAKKNVKLLIASRTTSNTVWSVLENDSRLFMWRHCSLRKTLDCCKILPTSESLSSMNIEVARNSYVTCLSLINSSLNTYSSSNHFHMNAEQLLVGTNRGVVIVVQALEMLPLTSFRPFNSEIEHILVCHPTNNRKRIPSDIIYPQLRHSTTSANLSQEESQRSSRSEPKGTFSSRRLSRFRGAGKSRTNSTDLDSSPLDCLSARGGEIYEAMSKGVKEMLSGSGLPVSSSAYGLDSITGARMGEGRAEDSDYFVTIGREYRCLLNRFTNISESPESTSTERCAIFWRSDDSSGWACK